jgi:hypothetical protein
MGISGSGHYFIFHANLATRSRYQQPLNTTDMYRFNKLKGVNLNLIDYALDRNLPDVGGIDEGFIS